MRFIGNYHQAHLLYTGRHVWQKAKGSSSIILTGVFNGKTYNASPEDHQKYVFDIYKDIGSASAWYALPQQHTQIAVGIAIIITLFCFFASA